MSKRRKRAYDFRVRPVNIEGTTLYNNVTIPYCTNCRGELTLDSKNGPMRHLDPKTARLSSRELIPKRGRKLKDESPSASKQAIMDREKARMKEFRKKKKDRKQQKREALDRLHERKKAERAARRKAKEAELGLVSALKTTR